MLDAPDDPLSQESTGQSPPAAYCDTPLEVLPVRELEPRSPYEPPQAMDSPPGQPSPSRAWLTVVLTSLLFASVHAPSGPHRSCILCSPC